MTMFGSTNLSPLDFGHSPCSFKLEASWDNLHLHHFLEDVYMIWYHLFIFHGLVGLYCSCKGLEDERLSGFSSSTTAPAAA